MHATVRRQVRSVLSDLDEYIPVPWDVDVLVARLAHARNRPMHLIPWRFPVAADRPTGLWLPSAQADYIFYDADATPTQRQQIIGHELAHVLLDHTPRLQDAPDELLATLAPAVNSALARRVLGRGRTGYAERDEAIAEEFGTTLIRRGLSKRKPSDPDELGRLTDALR